MADDEPARTSVCDADDLPPYVPPVAKPSLLDQLAGISMAAGTTISDNKKASDATSGKIARVRRKSRDIGTLHVLLCPGVLAAKSSCLSQRSTS